MPLIVHDHPIGMLMLGVTEQPRRFQPDEIALARVLAGHLAAAIASFRLNEAAQRRNEELNTQEQMKITWPATSSVAKAYIDQLTRSRAIQPERTRALTTALDRADGVRSGSDKNAAAVIDQLDALAKQVDADAGAASGRDAARMKSLAATITARAAKLR